MTLSLERVTCRQYFYPENILRLCHFKKATKRLVINTRHFVLTKRGLAVILYASFPDM